MTGVSLRNRTASVAGVIAIFASVMLGIDLLLALIVNSSWVDLAIFGACAIALGSVLDRHGVAINLRLADWFGSVDEVKSKIALDD